MRKCPCCGFAEPPIWRNRMHRLYEQYCRIDELQDWDKELTKLIKESKEKRHYVFKDGIKYQMNNEGYVLRIDAFLCSNPDPFNSSMTEPDKEKHRARVLGKPLHQKKLF